MEKKYSLLILFLVLVSLPLVNSASSNDFVKLDVEGKEVYTHKDLIGSRYLVGSDSTFYGSSEGQITMKLYLSDKLGSGNYRIGLRTKSKNITVKSVGVGESPIPVLSVASSSYDYPNLISLDGSLKEVTIVIEFDPNEIGLLEEFDVILYNDKGEVVAVYDPFISGFDFRQKLTLDTTQLSGDVTADHSILVYVDPTNTDFWTNDTLGTGNGITFAQSDETTQYDFNVEAFDNSDNNAWFWVEMTETYPSAVDLEQWMYYGGPDTDFSDGAGAYPSTYTAVYHLQEPSGTLAADSTTNFDATHANTPTLNVQSQIDKGVTYAKATSENTANNTLLDDGFSSISISLWVRKASDWNSAAVAQETIVFKQNTAADKGLVTLRWRADGKVRWQYIDSEVVETTHTIDSSKTSWAANTWFHLIGTMDTGSNDMNLYVNGSTADGGTLSEAMLAVAAGTQTNFGISADLQNSNFGDQTIDEVKVFRNVLLTADEALLLFLSESNQLITFGPEEEAFEADFTVSLDPVALDPENSLNTVTATLTDASISSNPITDWNYFIDTVQFFHSTVNGNTTRDFTVVGDFNVSLVITDNTNATTQKDANVTISQSVQGIDINFLLNTFTDSSADINFGVTFTGDANAFNWGFPSDQNQLTQNINKIFTTPGEKEVCVTIANLGDVNKTVCEKFIVGRVIVKIPLDITNLTELTPFNMLASENPSQSFSGLSADTNFFFFSDINFLSIIAVDLNSDFFSASKIFDFTSILNDFVFQPYLVPTSAADGLEITIFTIDNQNNRTSLPGIRVESVTDINGTSTLVESKFSDGTGVALFHFDLDKTYTLSFFQNGTLKLTIEIVPSSSNLFVFIETGSFEEPSAVGSVQIEWYSDAYFIPDANGLIALSQLLTPIAATIGDVNIIVTQDGVLIFNAVQTFNSNASDLNVAYDVNVSGLDPFKPLTVRLRIFDSVGFLILDKSGTYTFSTNVVFRDSVAGLREGLGVFASTLIAVLLTIFIVAGIIKLRPAQDNNWLFGIGATFVGIAVFFGFISFVPGVLGIYFGALLTIWKVRD